MAAALQIPPRAESGASIHSSLYPRSFMTDFDLQDNRYPSLSARTRQNPVPNPTSLSADMSSFDQQSCASGQSPSRRSSGRMDDVPLRNSEQRPNSRDRGTSRSARSVDLSTPLFTQDPQSYFPQDELQRRDPELRGRKQDTLYAGQNPNEDTRPKSYQEVSTRTNTPPPLRLNGGGDRPLSMLPSNIPRHPDVALNSAPPAPGGGQFAPIMPLSASPRYNPPVASRNRTYPQQPTYINQQANMSNGVNAVYTPIPPPQEEVCLECAMRDQDMADVDVTSPGVWERASDVQFEELREREEEEEANGIASPDERRPRARGGKLTEQNLKLWLSINPREPASRVQTLNTYVRAQRAMLEAEAAAHAKAMQEAAQLDNRMRDTYSQLRRSAYDTGASSSPLDDSGGVRIKPPHAPSSPMYHSHTRSHSREVTLLENGMIVEHVDVRKEEREARERRRKEEKRARKPSRSSVMDVTSIISASSAGPLADGGLKPYSAYSHAGSTRPVSELAVNDRPQIPRAYSQASFSDVHSLGSASPRRPKFFGMRNLSTGWRSQDSLAPSFAASGMSGSMVDMHVALQREDKRRTVVPPNDPSSSRRSIFWSNGDPQSEISIVAEEKAKKKKSGLIKWWRMVTGSNKPDPHVRNQPAEDDLPLAPPPPLSYLVNRGSAEVHVNGRQSSTPSAPLSTSPKFGQTIISSSPTAASPSSPRGGPNDAESLDVRTIVNGNDDTEKQEDGKGSGDWKVHSMVSEPNLRYAANPREPTPPVPLLPERTDSSRRSIIGVSREKSLPPIPTDETPAVPTLADRPMTMYTYDPRGLPPGTRAPHDFLPPSAPFRSADTRRQSFSGTSSRPDLSIQTLPVNQGNYTIRQSFHPQYDEFGKNQGPTGEYYEDERYQTASPQPKRKSKFGFASLLSKKNREPENNSTLYGAQPFPPMGRWDDATNGSMRLSMVSRKPLDELVAQDPEFVAYRYPSGDQQFDLLK